jgi:hypothetical protein
MSATADMKDVGSHMFCPRCFANLMSPKPQAEPEPEPEPFSFSFESEQVGALKRESERCFVCQGELPENGHTKLGSIGVCQSCREGLTLPPPEPPVEKKPVEQAQEVDPGPMYTPGSASYECSGCQRGMPGPGSFHEVDGAYYCPDCFYAGKAQAKAAKPVVSQGESSLAAAEPTEPLTQTPGAGEKCDACMRPLVRHYFEILSGFSICRACTSSNENLALTIARVRHKRHLEAIAQGLASGQS